MSNLEEEFALLLRYHKFPVPQREYKFYPSRRWRFDFAWPEQKIAVEIEGGVWINGRHNRASGFVKDLEKYNIATIEGWKVLRFTSTEIDNGEACKMLNLILETLKSPRKRGK